MNKLTKCGVAAVFSVTLTACGGTSIGDRVLAQAERFDDMLLRHGNMTPSGSRVVDATTGRVNFSGSAAIIEGNQFDSSVLVGDVDMQVDFDRADAVSGDISNITGGANLSDFDENAGDLDSYSSSIDLTGGAVGPGNSLSIDYSGTIRGNGETLVLGGTMNGEFAGNPSIRSLAAYDLEAGTNNGSDTVYEILVVAEPD